MLQTTIYLSVNRGGDTLTLDGNLSLFKELLTTLSDTARGVSQKDSSPAVTIPVENPNPEKETAL